MKYIPGLYIKNKHPNAPDFVVGKLSINTEKLKSHLNETTEEWINLDILKSQKGELYLKIDEWKPEPQEEKSATEQAQTESINPDDIPF